MKKPLLAILIIFISIIIIFFLLYSKKNTTKNEINQTQETTHDSEKEVPPEIKPVRSPSAIIGWAIALILFIIIVILLAKQKTGGDFDYEKFVNEMREKYGDKSNGVYRPLHTEIGCTLGYIKGKKELQRVAVTFTNQHYNGTPPRFMLHNYLVEPGNMKVHDHQMEMTHEEFLKYLRDVEFRSLAHPHAPHETPSIEEQAMQEVYKSGFKKGLGESVYD